MMKLMAVLAIAVFILAFSGAIRADGDTPSKMLQVRLGNLVAAEEVSGTVTFELTDSSGGTQIATKEFQADAGEPLEGLTASFAYLGPIRWKIHLADEEGRQLSQLEGDYPGYPYAVAAPLSSRLRVEAPEDSVVFLDFITFMLEFQAIAVLKENLGVERVNATAGLDSDGSGDFDPGEVVRTSANPENRLIKVTVPRLSSSVNVASFYIDFESPDGRQLANLAGTWTFDGAESVAFDLDAPQIRDITGFYGKPKPSQTVSTVALPNPWDLTLVSPGTPTDGVDFSFLLGRELELVWNEISHSETPDTAQALVTVVNEEGGVVEGAMVSVNGGEFPTDDFGQATIVAMPGSHEAVVTADGFQFDTFTVDFTNGETQFSQVILQRSGPGLVDKTGAFLGDHWPTLVLALSGAVALALLWMVIVVPTRYPSPVRGQSAEG